MVVAAFNLRNLCEFESICFESVLQSATSSRDANEASFRNFDGLPLGGVDHKVNP